MEAIGDISSHLCMALVTLFFFVNIVACDTCIQDGNCICVFDDGTKIDLTPLDDKNPSKPR